MESRILNTLSQKLDVIITLRLTSVTTCDDTGIGEVEVRLYSVTRSALLEFVRTLEELLHRCVFDSTRKSLSPIRLRFTYTCWHLRTRSYLTAGGGDLGAVDLYIVKGCMISKERIVERKLLPTYIFTNILTLKKFTECVTAH